MKRITTFIFIAFLVFGSIANAQRFDDVTFETIQVSDHVYMFIRAGGNIGIPIGDDGVFIIDDQCATLNEKIKATIKKLSDKDMCFLVNTHYHGDPTVRNENMQKLGATIIVYDNVRQRKSTIPKCDESMQAKGALTIIIFNDELSLHIKGEKIGVFHVANAHTDGDALL